MRPKRTFSRDFKLQVVRQLVTGEKRTSQVCREHDLCRTLVLRWREQYERDGESAWARDPATATVHVDADPQARIAALEAALGRSHLENEFLRKALEVAQKGLNVGDKRAMIDHVRTLVPGFPLTRACELVGLARSDYYREPLRVTAPRAMLDAIDTLVLEFPGYGYRRVTAQLRRDGWEVNHKRILRLMRDGGLLCQQKRRWRRTTDSRHGLEVYPNLLPDCGWRQLTAPNQAWVADLTYIRLPGEFCYLAAILDAYSRRVVGWSLSRSLEAGVVLEALERALARREPPTGWIHHSDRGVQYACRDYVQRLLAAGARISMTAKGSPRENAQAESFFRTLKREEVYVADYRGFGEAHGGIGRFIEEVYDRKRLHSALGYLPPIEFEERFAAGLPH